MDRKIIDVDVKISRLRQEILRLEEELRDALHERDKIIEEMSLQTAGPLKTNGRIR